MYDLQAEYMASSGTNLQLWVLSRCYHKKLPDLQYAKNVQVRVLQIHEAEYMTSSGSWSKPMFVYMSIPHI